MPVSAALFIVALTLINPAPSQTVETTKTFAVHTSWYDLDGRKMANGQRFNGRDKHLAAHRKFPLGTKLKLVNPTNSRSLVVEITDRGPYIRGRDLDISKAAADFLGFTEKGVTRLEATRIVTKPNNHG